MQTATDCIVLSSSPEHDAVPPPPSEKEALEKILHEDRLSPSPLPPKRSRAPTRSKYFGATDLNCTKTTNVRKAKQTAAEANDIVVEKQPAKKGRKPKTGAQMEVQDLEKTVAENKENMPMKPKRTRRKQGELAAGGDKLKNKTITGKVAKTGSTNSNASVAKSIEGDSTSKSTHERTIRTEDKGDRDGDLNLEQAVKRRLDWTPAKETAKLFTELQHKDEAEGGQKGLGSILSGYEYAGASSVADRIQELTDNGPTKRRRIELVDPRVLATKPKPLVDDPVQNDEEEVLEIAAPKLKKPKPRAKQPKTLTGRMTALYKTSTDANPTDQGFFKTIESSTGTKPKNRKTKEKDGGSPGFKFPPTIVLPPEAAVKSLDQQDLVFGTCSQLEREDSPTLLRDTQAAIQESEKEILSASSSRLDRYSGLGQQSAAISRYTPSRNLWSAAARDTEGSLVNIEVVDLVDSPEAPNAASLPIDDSEKEGLEQITLTEASESNDASVREAMPLGYSFCSGNSITSTTTTVKPSRQKPSAQSKNAMPHYKGKTDLELAKEIQSYGLRVLKKRDANIELLERCWKAKHGSATQNVTEESREATPMSSATSTFTMKTHQSESSKTASLNMPKAQSRSHSTNTQMIREHNGTTATSKPTATAASKVRQPLTKSQRHQDTGRQLARSPARGDRSSQAPPPARHSFIDVEEIQDSEDEDSLLSPNNILKQFLTKSPRNKDSGWKQGRQDLPNSPTPPSPSPTRSPKRKVPSSQQPSKKKANPKTPCSAAADPRPDQTLPSLNDQITKAVIAQPRQSGSPAGNLNRPSWHEKILMYDPIYLEDFTAWLNTEGLGLVDEDREVWPALVRDWCEMKGVCCCFRAKKGVGFH